MRDDLYKLVQHLQTRIDKLEEENAEIKKWVYRQKKRIDIITWLNQNIHPDISFNTWKMSISLGQKQLDYLLNISIQQACIIFYKKIFR